jgi:hypothetical protein
MLLRGLKPTYNRGWTVINWFNITSQQRTQKQRIRHRTGQSNSACSRLEWGPTRICTDPLLCTTDLLRLTEIMLIFIQMTHKSDRWFMFVGPILESRQLVCRRAFMKYSATDAVYATSSNLYIANTEVLLCASTRRQRQLATVSARINTDVVVPAHSVRDLGIYLDASMMRTHVAS